MLVWYWKPEEFDPALSEIPFGTRQDPIEEVCSPKLIKKKLTFFLRERKELRSDGNFQGDRTVVRAQNRGIDLGTLKLGSQTF